MRDEYMQPPLCDIFLDVVPDIQQTVVSFGLETPFYDVQKCCGLLDATTNCVGPRPRQ